MDEDKYQLAKWDKYDIKVSQKDENLSWHVIDVLLNLRRLWLMNLIDKQKEALKNANESERTDIFNDIKDYLVLFKIVSKKLNRLV
jgi:hypothetical protein